MVFAVDNTQRLITGGNVVNADTERHNVRQLLERGVFLLHFAPDGIRRFFPPRHLTFDAVVFHVFFQRLNNLRHQIAALLAQEVQTGDDGVVSLLVELAKGQFLQFAFHFLHADAFGQRSVNVKRFAGNPGTLFRRQKMQRPHVVQPVCQFDQKHPDVFRHRQQQLAEIFRLFGISGLLFDHRQFGQTVHQRGHLVAEQLTHLFHRGVGVLHRIMQKPGDHRSAVQFKLGQNTGHFDRMRIIRVAGCPKLRPVLFHGKNVSTVERVLVGVRIVRFYQID